MFGIDFPELVIIAVVALIVIGPEHLPKVARTIGHLWGRGQRYVNGVKADISRDMALDELRQMQQKMEQEAGDIGKTVNQTSQELERELKNVEGSATASASEMPRHEIIEEQHNVSEPELPLKTEQKHTPNT